MSYAIIFDTNLYRSLSDAALDELCTLEAEAGYAKSASFLAASELLGRVDAKATSANAIAPVRRLWRHCVRRDASGEFVELSPDPHGVVAHAVFNLHHPHRHRTAEYFGATIRAVASAMPGRPLPDVAEALSRIREHRDATEARFVDQLRHIRSLLGLDPTAPSPFTRQERPTVEEFLERGMARDSSAAAIILNAAAEHGFQLTDDDARNLGRLHAKSMRVTLRVFDALIAKVLRSGANPVNFANDIWDAYFGLFASDWARVNGRRFVLVTDDHGLLSAAEVERVPERVISLESYRGQLAAA